jgi:hypothetical protein
MIRQPQQACCPAPACRAQLQLETFTHAFVTCPITAPVVAWLFSIYQALTSTTPPEPAQVPLVLLADLPGVWTPKCQRTWQRLRVAFLGCAWQVRCSQLADTLGQQAALELLAQKVVSTMTSAVQRDWQRIPTRTSSVLGRARDLHLPATWFAGRSPDLKREEFDAMWPATQPPWFVPQQAGGLQVKLSLTWPVQFPPHLQPPAPPPVAAVMPLVPPGSSL